MLLGCACLVLSELGAGRSQVHTACSTPPSTAADVSARVYGTRPGVGASCTTWSLVSIEIAVGLYFMYTVRDTTWDLNKGHGGPASSDRSQIASRARGKPPKRLFLRKFM